MCLKELFSIRDARPSDMSAVDALAHAEGMDSIPGPSRVRVAVNGGGEVVGFCRLQDDANGIAYVNPVVVYRTWRGYGVGRALIEDARAAAGELRLVSRGASEGFYRRLGFTEMPWSDVDLKAASEDCDNCPYRSTCNPLPMRLT